MQALAIIDMQRWMFRLPERMAQLAAVVPAMRWRTVTNAIAT